MNRLKLFFYALFVASTVILSGCRWFQADPEGEIDPVGINTLPPAGNDTLNVADINGQDTLDVNFEPAAEGIEGGVDAPPPGKPGEWQVISEINLPTIYFAYDQDRIGTSERAKLDQVAEYLQSNPEIGVIIEGHCDERGSIEYNRTLGERRSIAVRNYLVNLGIPDSRFQTTSYGEERPAVEGSSAEAFTKNRRAELKAAKMN